VGEKVRKTIQELGRTMPENLPPAENIKKLETKKKKQPKALKSREPGAD
jgi:DNA-damage-inducible protein D